MQEIKEERVLLVLVISLLQVHICYQVHHGNIADAIERVNDLNPEILET